MYHPRLARGNWDAEAMKEILCKPGKTHELTTSGGPKKFLRRHLTKDAQVVASVVQYNLRPQSHTYYVPMNTVGLVYCILKEELVDITRVVANELRRVVLNGTCFGDRNKCCLSFPDLIWVFAKGRMCGFRLEKTL